MNDSMTETGEAQDGYGEVLKDYRIISKGHKKISEIVHTKFKISVSKKV